VKHIKNSVIIGTYYVEERILLDY